MPSTKGDIKKSYVSTFGLDKPEIREQVVDIFNEKRFLNIFVRTGAKEVSKQWSYKTVYNEQLFRQGDTTGSTVTGNNSTTIGTTTTAGTSGYARKTDMVEFITSGKIGYITNVVPSAGADTLTIVSVDGTNITHVAGEKLIIFSNAQGEKNDSIENIRYGLTSKVNKIHSLREKSEITNVENASIKYVKWNGVDRWYAKDHIEKKLRLERMIDATFFKSEMSATSHEDANPVLIDPNGGGSVQTTRGFNKYLENDGGIILACATPGTYVLADEDMLADAWNASRVPDDITALGGDGALRKISAFNKNLNSSGVTSAKLEVNGVEFNWNVEKKTYGRFNVSYGSLPILNDPDMMGGTISAKSVFFLPMGERIKTQDDSYVPILRTRYMKNQTKYGNDMVGEIHSGALSPFGANGTKQEWVTEFVTDQGLEFLGPQLGTRLKVLA